MISILLLGCSLRAMECDKLYKPTTVGVVPMQRDFNKKEFLYKFCFKKNDQGADAFFVAIKDGEEAHFAAARLMEGMQLNCTYKNYNDLALADYIYRNGVELKDNSSVIYLVPLLLRQCTETYDINQETLLNIIKCRSKNPNSKIGKSINSFLIDLFVNNKERILMRFG